MTKEEFVMSRLNGPDVRQLASSIRSRREREKFLDQVVADSAAEYDATARRPASPEAQRQRVDAALQRQRDAGLLDAEPSSAVGRAADATWESVKDFGRSAAAMPGAIKKYGESLGEGAAEFVEDPRAALAGAAEGALESLPGRIAMSPVTLLEGAGDLAAAPFRSDPQQPIFRDNFRDKLVKAAKDYRYKRSGISGVTGDAARDAAEGTGDLALSVAGGVVGAAAGPAGSAVGSSIPGAIKTALTGGDASDVAQAFGHGIAMDRALPTALTGKRAFKPDAALGGAGGLARKLISSGTRGGLEAAEAAGAKPTPYFSEAPFEGGDFAEGKPLHSRVVDGQRQRLGNSEDDVGWVAGRQARKYAGEIEAKAKPLREEVAAADERAVASGENLVPISEKAAAARKLLAPWEGLSFAADEGVAPLRRALEIMERGERGDVHASRQPLIDRLAELDKSDPLPAPDLTPEEYTKIGGKIVWAGKPRPGGLPRPWREPSPEVKAAAAGDPMWVQVRRDGRPAGARDAVTPGGTNLGLGEPGGPVPAAGRSTAVGIGDGPEPGPVATGTMGPGRTAVDMNRPKHVPRFELHDSPGARVAAARREVEAALQSDDTARFQAAAKAFEAADAEYAEWARRPGRDTQLDMRVDAASGGATEATPQLADTADVVGEGGSASSSTMREGQGAKPEPRRVTQAAEGEDAFAPKEMRAADVVADAKKLQESRRPKREIPKGFITQGEREMLRQTIDKIDWSKSPVGDMEKFLRSDLYRYLKEHEPADLRAAREKLHAHKSLSDEAAKAGWIKKPKGGGDPITSLQGQRAVRTALSRYGTGTRASGNDAALLEGLLVRDAAEPLPGGGIKEAMRLAREMRTARALSPAVGRGALSLGITPAIIRNWESAMVRGVGATGEALSPHLARGGALGNMAAKMEENKRRAMDALRKKMKMGASR